MLYVNVHLMFGGITALPLLILTFLRVNTYFLSYKVLGENLIHGKIKKYKGVFGL